MRQYEPKHFEPKPGRITFHQRARVVIHQPTFEEAEALAEKLSEEMACDVEMFLAVVDDSNEDAGEDRGEVVIGRKFFPCKAAMVPAEA